MRAFTILDPSKYTPQELMRWAGLAAEWHELPLAEITDARVIEHWEQTGGSEQFSKTLILDSDYRPSDPGFSA